MARLAAYYQEDFHYPVVGYKPKPRKSAYGLDEDNLCRTHLSNRKRIRSLAASEPTLAPKFAHPSETDAMSLHQRHSVYGSQLMKNPHSSVQQMDNSCRNSRLTGYGANVFENDSGRNSRLTGYGANVFENDSCRHSRLAGYDNDSMSSFGEMLAFDSRRSRPHHRDRRRNRLSYAEPNSSHVPHQTFGGRKHQRISHEAEFPDHNNRILHPEYYFTDSIELELSPRSFYRPESRQVRGQFLSPPSPLDSGLSSQSITSSPSLEAEPISFRGDAFRKDVHPRCICPRVTYPEARGQLHGGRISPGTHSVSHMMSNDRSGLPNCGKTLLNVGVELDHNDHPFHQIRYGKLGIVGEPSNSEPSRRRLDANLENAYSEENRSTSVTRPCVIIIDSPEKSESSEGSSERLKSPSPESPMSVTASESSSNNELDSGGWQKSGNHELDSGEWRNSRNHELDSGERRKSGNHERDSGERRKSGKTTESEIRELEDMYKRCNLNDRDLLDRAERRDLPTPHQHRLTRSHSDTLYEVFRNPYETRHRAPPLRRSGLPDRIADDMALRKLQKPVSHPGPSPADNTITYMLCSSHFTPTVPVGKDILFHDYPDVELDDFSYRKHYFGKKSKMADPQPPFGIPLRPPLPRQVFTDYLHLLPSDVPQPLCHARRHPDVVRDDLAFRTLRKEEPERLYYDISQFYKKNKR